MQRARLHPVVFGELHDVLSLWSFFLASFHDILTSDLFSSSFLASSLWCFIPFFFLSVIVVVLFCFCFCFFFVIVFSVYPILHDVSSFYFCLFVCCCCCCFLTSFSWRFVLWVFCSQLICCHRRMSLLIFELFFSACGGQWTSLVFLSRSRHWCSMQNCRRASALAVQKCLEINHFCFCFKLRYLASVKYYSDSDSS